MYKYFLLIIGSTQIIIALIESVFPQRAFQAWVKWVSNRFFPFHGIGLIFIGLPLTAYRGHLSSVIFYIGIFIVFTGPFILIYPEKIRKVFSDSGEIFKNNEIKMMIYVDAFFRLCIGSIFLFSCWKTFFN